MGKYYMNAINGSDTDGNGSRKFPYATIEKLLNVKGSIVEDTTIMLGDGNYPITSNLTRKLTGNATLDIIGKGKNTVVICVGNYASGEWDRTGVGTSTIKFSRLYWKTNTLFNSVDVYTKMCFYNVYFYIWFSGKYIYATSFGAYYGELYFENCVGNYMQTNVNGFPLTCVNCYFGTTATSSGNLALINTVLVRNSWDSILNVDKDCRITDEALNLRELGVFYGVRKWGFTDTLIKMNGCYYNIELENYDSTTKTYNPISTREITTTEFSEYSFNVLDDLFVELTVDGETFKPIDKFDNFSFVCSDIVETKALGLKYQKGLAVRSLDEQTDFYDVVHYLSHTFDRTTTTTTNADCETITEYTNTTDIRIVFSTDAGDTWFTWDGYGFVTTDIIIPKKMYEDMTDAEKTQWDVAVDEVLTSGVTLDVANSLDYNIDRTQKLRWAYAFRRDTYSDISQVNNTELKYDMKHSYRELQDSEYDFSIFEHSIEITSHIDTTEMKVNAVL